MDHFSRSIPEFPSVFPDNESMTKSSCMKTRIFPADFRIFRSLEQNTEKYTSCQLKLNIIMIVLKSSIHVRWKENKLLNESNTAVGFHDGTF